jgi:glycosyltransferase involved in cell wall biosynthesis
MYRSEEFVAEVIESILALDYDDFAVVAIDDCSPDSTFAVASTSAAADPRIIVEANPERLGMIANWNRVLARTYELHPDFQFFAWASDNDFREAAWISVLTCALEENPRAAMAYSRFGTIEDGRKSDDRAIRWLFETRDIADPYQRLRATRKGMRAGAIMYGLHRRSTLEQVGDVPSVLLSDVLFLSHLSLYGTFVQVPEILWYRGSRRTGAESRIQRAALFARPPLTTFLPVSLQHTLWLIRRLLIDGRRPPGIGRGKALLVSVTYLTSWSARLIRRRLVRVKARARKRLLEARRKRKRLTRPLRRVTSPVLRRLRRDLPRRRQRRV